MSLELQSNLHQISVHYAPGRGSILLCRVAITLCTSGFMDNVKFAHSEQAQATRKGRMLKVTLQEAAPFSGWSFCLWLPYFKFVVILCSHKQLDNKSLLSRDEL